VANLHYLAERRLDLLADPGPVSEVGAVGQAVWVLSAAAGRGRRDTDQVSTPGRKRGPSSNRGKSNEPTADLR